MLSYIASSKVTNSGTFKKITPISDVIALVSNEKYTEVRHMKGVELIDDSLISIESNTNAFLRISRSALVAKDKITGINSHRGVLSVIVNDTEYSVSRRNQANVRRFYKQMVRSLNNG